MSRLSPWALALLVVSIAGPGAPPLAAQQPVPPSPEELAERAERAPLFASHDRLALLLRTDVSWIREERPDEDEAEGTLSFTGADGSPVTVPVRVRARGEFRRDRRNCNFPPLRLNLPTGEVAGTVFDGQDKLKLVTPCHESRDAFQQYVLQEYLVYRVFQLLTPVSFRVRLVEITYQDPDGGYDTRTRTAFLIEDEDQMAARNHATLHEVDQVHPFLTEGSQSELVALFQYMIGNTDFSAPFFHNSTMIRQEAGRLLVVPYDFDWSGVVNARYAVPDPQLPIRSVRERIFRGFCRDDVDHAALIRRFNEVRDAVWTLYGEMADLEDGQRKRALEYYETFYETINDPRRYDREVMRACRQVLP